jgi:hypothetical protein
VTVIRGLLQAVGSKLPGAYHAMCCQHIAENIHKRFGKDYKARFWEIARATTESAFDTAIQALRRDAPEVEEHICSIGYNTFAFAHFPYPQFGHGTQISWNPQIQFREIFESSHPVSLLMEYTSGMLRHSTSGEI